MKNDHAIVYDWEKRLLDEKRQHEVRKRWLQLKLARVLPEVMKREGLDMWIVANRETNDDPVYHSLTLQVARRQAILVFFLKPDGELETLSVSRYGLGIEGFYEPQWLPDKEEQWDCLARVVKERNPGVIGLNFGETFGFGDGISYTQYNKVLKALGSDYFSRIKSAERVAVGWLETRIKEEMEAYPGMMELTHGIIAEAFSSRVIHPGVTTTDDVLWWFNNRLPGFGCGYVKVQRPGSVGSPEELEKLKKTGSDQDLGEITDTVIRPGDIVRCDVGISYLGLHTDVQQNAYVLKDDEEDAPEGLKVALKNCNRLQDILAGEFIEGRTGNEILRAAREKCEKEGLEVSIYSHPIGTHGHGAGPTIGLWDQQDKVEGPGDYALFENTCYAMELNAVTPVPEWNGQKVKIALETEISFSGGKVDFTGGRQTKFHLIR